jgi:outer membrane protein OmpA-like peptidoglycan-associated protein
MTRRLFAPLVAVVSAAVVAGLAAAPINLSGTWQPRYWIMKISLQQDGDRVWGYGGAKDFWFRGYWEGNRLLLVVNNFQEKRKGCKPRGAFALTGTTVTNLNTVWLQPGGRKTEGQWTRLSPDAGEPLPYPYLMELTECGFLRTYELLFATGSDKLLGTDWPLLAAVSEVLKGSPSTKIEITGHTDSTGDPAANKDLSGRRAASVKRTLVSRYGGEAARIATKGWGSEQPIEDNKTEEGRALNRRVEIVLSR